jgi:phosphate transport system permease protein
MPKRIAQRTEFLGDGLTALCGGCLAFNLILVIALLVILVVNGGAHFWQRDLVELTLDDGSRLLGEIHEREEIPDDPDEGFRIRLRVANRDLTGIDFLWIDESRIVEQSRPADVVALEREEYGNFFGRMVELRRDDDVLAAGVQESWSAFRPLHSRKRDEAKQVRRFERSEIGDVNYSIERLRLERRKLELSDLSGVERQRRRTEIDERLAAEESRFEALSQRLFDMRDALQAEHVVMESAGGERQEVVIGEVVRAVRPNEMSRAAKLGLYASRIREFVFDDPRESNTEGGIFPAIFGTVMMVFLMSFAVAPLGVLAALYLREYAKQGPLVRIVRIAVNNLAGVPSIVFGVFGLGFFVYLIGGSIDSLFFAESLPTPTYGTGGILWASLTLALLTVPVVIVATEEGLAAVPRIVREGSLALGATKFETTWRVVVPAAAPGILTGLILAMARAAGEVAPLMIVGMVKLAPALPVDGYFPFVHFERKFMHLGFHIYDVGFQSPNVEATKPLVFATALLLILVVTAMNLVAIALRNRIRAKYAGSAV